MYLYKVFSLLFSKYVMYKDDCVGRVCKLPFLSDFVRITGQEWHKNPEGKIYTELKGRRVFLDDETSPENRNPSAAPSKEGACVGIELPLLKPDGTMLENTFAIVPAQYRKWFKNM